MGLVDEKVKIKWSAKTKKYYMDLGYLFTKMGDEFEIRVEDLTKGSKTRVRCKCDGCGKNLIWNYKDYNNQVKENGKTYCCRCSKNLSKNKCGKKQSLSQSFYDWCIEHNREDVLERWDYELNNCSPKDISYGTCKKYYFRCGVHDWHESELKLINSFTNGQEGSIKCNQCKSIAQYILDNFPNKDLYEVWDKDENGDVNPWMIPAGAHKKYWFICQEKDYHGSYEMAPHTFSIGHRCPYCSNNHGKVHPKDSLGQYIVDNYGEDFLHKVWSDKNEISPFEVSPNAHKKVWWKCIDERHEDYLRNCYNSFYYEFRCPKCVEEMNNSIIEKKAKEYLVDIGYSVLTEYKCTLRVINPKTKMPMPYDNEIILPNGKHLIIEVHGEQHYKESSGYTKGTLKQRKLYDRYKKYVACKNGYEYLELPYWVFKGKNKDQYKQMIDNKIKEILEKEEIA